MKAPVLEFTLNTSDLDTEFNELQLEICRTEDGLKDNPPVSEEPSDNLEEHGYIKTIKQELEEWGRVKHIGEIKKEKVEKSTVKRDIFSDNKFIHQSMPEEPFTIQYVLKCEGSTILEEMTGITRVKKLNKPLEEVIDAIKQLDRYRETT